MIEVALVVGAVGAIALVGAVAWPLYVKPALRRRYERDHHRKKTGRRHSK